MKIKNVPFEDFVSDIRQFNKRIVVFGAGVIGTVTVPNVLRQYGELERLFCYIDNDVNNQGTAAPIEGISVPVFGAKYLESLNPSEYVLVLAISRFMEVLEQLESYEWTKEWECYLAPSMSIESFAGTGGKGAVKDFDHPVIPKKIHYMWLGGKPIPSFLEKCMESWKKFCPDYEIIRWDESNYDLNKNLYMRQAYDNGAYGFVPDYGRIDILLEHGGIYLDTDVELIRPIDDLLYQEAFCGVEKWQTINLGGMSGSIPGQAGMKALLTNREDLVFVDADGKLNKRTCGFYDTKALIAHGYKLNGQIQKILGMNVYTSDFFHPYDYMSGRLEQTSDTYSIHHFNGGWLTEEMRRQNELIRKKYDELLQH
ncbi:glycosyltransferase family 32 protein [Butyrivibrio sp. VCB2006]|uniref:glycosyltransferase family 32 protein n=1 Tax=Butyrivibrio sp. VCB2006 TaxID=1280679 RepID=UPI000421A053|nr:glycosyltransferase [Butyrivibrio sp. VCB2006]